MAVDVSFREELSGEPVGLSTCEGDVQDPLREQNKHNATVSERRQQSDIRRSRY